MLLSDKHAVKSSPRNVLQKTWKYKKKMLRWVLNTSQATYNAKVAVNDMIPGKSSGPRPSPVHKALKKSSSLYASPAKISPVIPQLFKHTPDASRSR